MGRDVQQTAEAVGDVLRHIIQPRRAHGVLGTPFTLRIVGGQQTDRRQLDYTELGMWRNFTHCGVLYAHVPEVDPLASPPAPRDAAGPTAEPATAADPTCRPKSGARPHRGRPHQGGKRTHRPHPIPRGRHRLPPASWESAAPSTASVCECSPHAVMTPST